MKRSSSPVRLPDFVEPMKAKLVSSMPTGDWIYEIKFDSYRAFVLQGYFVWKLDDVIPGLPQIEILYKYSADESTIFLKRARLV
jgi:hypothetical protein